MQIEILKEVAREAVALVAAAHGSDITKDKVFVRQDKDGIFEFETAEEPGREAFAGLFVPSPLIDGSAVVLTYMNDGRVSLRGALPYFLDTSSGQLEIRDHH